MCNDGQIQNNITHTPHTTRWKTPNLKKCVLRTELDGPNTGFCAMTGLVFAVLKWRFAACWLVGQLRILLISQSGIQLVC